MTAQVLFSMFFRKKTRTLMPLRWANECGSAEMIKKSTHIWDLIGAFNSTSPVSCRNHSYPLILFTQTINQKETHDQDMFNSKKIASYPHGLRTQNPGIREVSLETSPKRGSAKINLLRQGKQTATEKNLYNAS